MASVASMNRSPIVGSAATQRGERERLMEIESRPDHAVVPGQDIGGCRIVQHVGTGGMGQVFLAQHLALQKPVAVKILPPDWGHPQAVERFIREARTCSRIEHPNVVTIHDAGSARGLHYIVMQYVDGRNLSQLVEEVHGPLPWRAACRLIRETAKGLAAVHRQNLIHRDVKPHNIMLSSDGRVLLMDFGLVHDDAEAPQRRAATVVGTPSYMSPEQVTARQMDHRSDLFSLGTTFYFVLTGVPPYRGDTRRMMQAIGSGAAPRPVHEVNPSVPQEVSVLVARAMAFAPEDRIQNAQAMVHMLQQLLKQSDKGPEDGSGTRRRNDEDLMEIFPEQEATVELADERSVEIPNETQHWVVGGLLLGMLLLLVLILNMLFLAG